MLLAAHERAQPVVKSIPATSTATVATEIRDVSANLLQQPKEM